MSLLLIAELQGQIKRRDERIAELEAAQLEQYDYQEEDDWTTGKHNAILSLFGQCDCKYCTPIAQPIPPAPAQGAKA